MAKTVKLQHMVRRVGNQFFPMYDGNLVAENGLLEIPADRPDWIKRAWISGYTLTPDGRRLFNMSDVEAEVAKQTAESEESAESAEESSEDSDSGRQPEANDGVRESEPDSGESVPESRPRSRRRRGADKAE